MSRGFTKGEYLHWNRIFALNIKYLHWNQEFTQIFTYDMRAKSEQKWGNLSRFIHHDTTNHKIPSHESWDVILVILGNKAFWLLVFSNTATSLESPGAPLPCRPLRWRFLLWSWNRANSLPLARSVENRKIHLYRSSHQVKKNFFRPLSTAELGLILDTVSKDTDDLTLKASSKCILN